MTNDLLFGIDLNRSDLVYSHDFDTDFQESEVPINNFDPGTFLETSVIKPRYHTKTDTFAAFAEDRLAITEKFSLVGGVRFEYNKTGRWNFAYSGNDIVGENPALNGGTTAYKSLQHTTWRVGAVYQPTRDLSFYAQYATAVDPIGGLAVYSTSGTAFQLTNANGRQFEAGVKGLFMDGTGLLHPRRLPDREEQSVHPAGEQRPDHPGRPTPVAGASRPAWPCRFRAVSRSMPTARSSNADADLDESDDHDTPAGVPEQAGQSRAVVERDRQAAGARATCAMSAAASPTTTTSSASRPIRWSISARLTRSPRTSASMCRVYNLFDKAYAEGIYFDQQWILGRPRSFDVSVRAAF